jgi:hypothetical protein
MAYEDTIVRSYIEATEILREAEQLLNGHFMPQIIAAVNSNDFSTAERFIKRMPPSATKTLAESFVKARRNERA